MQLTSPHPYWLLRNGLGEGTQLKPLPRRADVAIVGGGVSGALLADALTEADLKVVLLEARYAGLGSTSASTALLQYEIDTHLGSLIERVGERRAVDAYAACLAGLREVGRLARSLGEVDFRRRPSLYFASRRADESELRAEGTVRRRYGLPCETWGRRDIERHFDFSAPVALWTTSAAEVDPYRLCHALFDRAGTRDFTLCERVRVEHLIPESGGVVLHTGRGQLKAKHVVVAAGYEAAAFLPRPAARLYTTYAVITEPIGEFQGWHQRCLIWESARPYLYVRTTSDNRVLVGGRDRARRDGQNREGEIERVGSQLLRDASRLLPQMDFSGAYAWAGVFGQTRDGLGYIGPHPELDPRISFLLGYGGNGITYSAIGARVLTARIQGKRHRYGETFAFAR